MSAKNCRRDAMILLFMLAITLAFVECQCELERLGNGVSKTHGNLAFKFRPRGKFFPMNAQSKVIAHEAFILYPSD